MRRNVPAVQALPDLVTISVIAVEDLVDRLTERLDLGGLEHALVAQAALRALQEKVQIDHQQRYAAG